MKVMQMLWGKEISDLAFSEFANVLEYKTNVVKIDRFFPSSRTCQCCGYVLEKLDLKQDSRLAMLVKASIKET